MRVDVTVSEAATLLKTDFDVFEHQSTKKRALACDQYSLPREIKSLVDFVSPTVHLPEEGSLYERNQDDGNFISSMVQFDGPVNASTSPSFSPWDTTYCGNYSTPACIQALYNMPNGTKKAYVFKLNSSDLSTDFCSSTFGVVELAYYVCCPCLFHKLAKHNARVRTLRTTLHNISSTSDRKFLPRPHQMSSWSMKTLSWIQLITWLYQRHSWICL